MNQKTPFFLMVLPIILTVFLLSTAQAEWWQNASVREKLSLTEDQVKEMDRIFTAYQKARVDRQAEIKKIQIHLNNLLAQEKVDEKKAEQGISDLGRARNKMLKEMITMKLDIKKVLSTEQIRLVLAAEPDTFDISNSWASKRHRMRRSNKRGNVVVKEGGEQ